MKDLKVIGLTGGIGSGKSTAAELFARKGALVIDADLIARELTSSNGGAIEEIKQQFKAVYGVKILNEIITKDNALNRDGMRSLILKDNKAKEILEKIIHPAIYQRGLDIILQSSKNKVIIWDIPLLVENISRWRDRLDKIIVVDCERETQISRVIQRSIEKQNNWKLNQVENIINLQAAREQRIAVADFVINNGNNISLETLKCQVDEIWRNLTLKNI